MDKPPENSENPPWASGAKNNGSQTPSSGTNLEDIYNVGDFYGLANLYVDNDNKKDDGDAYLESFPRGYRFVPTDEDLISWYLIPKIKKQRLPPNRIHQEDVYKYSPEELSERYKSQGENSWYFFTPRERKYMNGDRPKRSAGNGYWKATGADKEVYENGDKIGSRKALVYHQGKPPNGEKQPWIMHEYKVSGPSRPIDGKDRKLDDCVLCKIYKKTERSNNLKKKNQAQARPQPQSVLNQDQGTGNASPQSSGTTSMELDNGNNNNQYHDQPTTMEPTKPSAINSSRCEVGSTSHQIQSFSLPIDNQTFDNNYHVAMINSPNCYDSYFFNPYIGQYQFHHHQQQQDYWYTNNNNDNVMFPMDCKSFVEDPPNFGMNNYLADCMMTMVLPPDEEQNQPSQQRGENENQPSSQPRD